MLNFSSGPKNRKRNKKRTSRHHEYYEEASPSTGHARDARYTDMAPK